MIARFLGVSLTALSLSCAAASADDGAQFTMPHITVSGYSSVAVKPDVAYLHLGVVTEKPTAAEAQSENATSATSVIATLKELGIDRKDIQTSSLTLEPMFVEEGDTTPRAVTKRTLTGYRASNILIVTIHDVDKAGAIVSHVVEAGANSFRSIDFEVSDYSDRADEQRAKAVAVAMHRAQLFASGGRQKLGRLLAIDPEADRNDGSEAALPTKKGPSPGPQVVVIPVEPGLVEVGARVTATWELFPE